MSLPYNTTGDGTKSDADKQNVYQQMFSQGFQSVSDKHQRDQQEREQRRQESLQQAQAQAVPKLSAYELAKHERAYIPESLEQRKEFQRINGSTLLEFTRNASVTSSRSSEIKNQPFDALPLPEMPTSESRLHIPVHEHKVDEPEDLNLTIMPPTTQQVVHNLLLTSDYFLETAHKSVTQTNSEEGESRYYTMIKIVIKSLLMIVKKYKHALDPQLESYAHYKLAKVYFEETENIERADEYVNKAINISTRNNLISIRFQSEFLAAQIIGKTNPNLLSNYLNEKARVYQSLGLTNYESMFHLLQINNLLVLDPQTGLILLQTITKSPSLDLMTRMLCLLYQSNLHLHRGSPMHSRQLLLDADGIVKANSNVPIQLLAMFYLSSYLNFIQTNNVAQAKEYMQLISKFMLNEQNSGWNNWSDDGSFRIHVSRDVSYKVSWLNSDEFVVMFYFLTGVNLLNEAANGKKKARKVFDKCLQIIDKQLHDLSGSSMRNFAVPQLRQSSLKMTYIKFCVNFYQAWSGFISNEVKATNYLNEFMSQFNKGFGKEELCYYKTLIPRILYLFAVHYHFKGDLQAAKYYYLKVRNMTAAGTQADGNQIAALQLQLGIGPDPLKGRSQFSELFVYSTLHLLILNEYEAREIAKVGNTSDKLNSYYKLRQILHQDLIGAFEVQHSSNTFSLNFTNSNDLIKLTYHLLLNTFNDQPLQDVQQQQQQNSTNSVLLNEMANTVEKFQDVSYFPFILNLICYLIFVGTNNIEQKNIYLAKCLSIISTPSDSDNHKIINVFILRSLVQHFRSSGENDKASMAEFQLEFFYNSLADKFKFLLGNIDTN